MSDPTSAPATETRRIPMLDLVAQYETIRAEVDEAIARVVRSQKFIGGPEVEALEREIAEFLQCGHAIGVSSGTDALLVALLACEIGAGDEVITTPYSFVSTASSIARAGARPVFVDINPATFNLDVTRLESAVTERTRAILPVHLFGLPSEMDPLLEFAKDRNLRVIEDAAQAIGAEYRGRRAGSMGDFGCLSFYPSKNLGGFGDGGMVTTNDENLADRVRMLSNHGFSPKYHSRVLGGNFRLDAIQAAVLRVKLRHLDTWTEARRDRAETYRRFLEDAKPKIFCPREPALCRHVYNQFVIRAPGRRDELAAMLDAQGVATEVYYPVPFHLQECFARLGQKPGDFPHSEDAARETLALPLYPELPTAMQQPVAQAITSFFADS